MRLPAQVRVRPKLTRSRRRAALSTGKGKGVSAQQTVDGMISQLTHLALARRFRWLIVGTYVLLTVENVFTVLTPWLVGRIIDGLLAGEYRNLMVFYGVAFLAVIVGMVRRMFDTRAYGHIYRVTAAEMAAHENAANRPVSAVSARVAFVKEFTDFFEIMLPTAMMSIVMLLGAMIMLSFLSMYLCAATLVAAGCVTLVFYFSRNAIGALNTLMNDETERQVEILETRRHAGISAHFQSIVGWRVALSDIEARNFGAVFLLTLGLTGLAAFIMIVIEDKSEGQVFAAITYVIQFSQSVVILPYAYQQFIRTNEMSGRLTMATPDWDA